MARINFGKVTPPRSRKPLWIGVLFLTAFLFGTLTKAALPVDGTEANAQDYPYAFGMKLSSSDSDGGACTAFLVAPQLVLTAAHCLQTANSVETLANGTDLNGRNTSGTEVSVSRFHARPEFKTPYSGMSQEDLRLNASIDIGYITLKDPATITPIPVYVAPDRQGLNSLFGKVTTLVGYGADKFLGILADYSGRATFVKRLGTMKVTEVEPGYVHLEGEKGGALPGDSGGPELAEFDGVTKVFAINHGMQGKQTVTERVIKSGKHKGEIERVVNTDNSVYGTTIGTLLTTDNLCWAIQDSGQKIPGVVCPEVSAPEKPNDGQNQRRRR